VKERFVKLKLSLLTRTELRERERERERERYNIGEQLKRGKRREERERDSKEDLSDWSQSKLSWMLLHLFSQCNRIKFC
jgi:hypothetical protein